MWSNIHLVFPQIFQICAYFSIALAIAELLVFSLSITTLRLTTLRITIKMCGAHCVVILSIVHAGEHIFISMLSVVMLSAIGAFSSTAAQ